MVRLSFVFIFFFLFLHSSRAHLDVFTGIRFDASFILYSNQNLSNLMTNLKAILFFIFFSSSSPKNVLLLCLVYTKRFALFSLPLSLSFCFCFVFYFLFCLSMIDGAAINFAGTIVATQQRLAGWHDNTQIYHTN